MMKPWLAFPLALLMTSLSPAGEAKENRARLTSFAELEKRIGDSDLRILDARPRADYEKGHIPGAIWVDAKEAGAIASKPGALNDQEAWETWLTPLGIGPETEVLVYEGGRQLDAARLWWLLSYLGVERVGLLNGNFPLWAEENRPVTTDEPRVEPKPFKVVFQDEKYATRDKVLAAIGAESTAILDVRSDDEFAGTRRLSKRGGHVPSACHLEWINLVDENGRFLDEPAAREKLAKAGVAGDGPVITHCQSGGRSSVSAFVLDWLGFQAQNYYQGWSDWGNAEDTPVTTEKTSAIEEQ